uniref:GSVIVT00024351001 n=1 Tax=Arundo donax TaxID=35708 RepID=A0A0A9BJB8_ARUDO
MTPPAVSRPRDSGVTSSRSRSCTFSLPSPLRMAAWTAAPYATASSGLMLLHSSLPLKKSCSSCCTLGIRVEPPTSTTSCTPLLSILASRRHFSTGSMHLRNKSMFSSSKRALVIVE